MICRWAVVTNCGIFEGDMEGKMEEGETEEEAVRYISITVCRYIMSLAPVDRILACMITDGNLSISCPIEHEIVSIDRDITAEVAKHANE